MKWNRFNGLFHPFSTRHPALAVILGLGLAVALPVRAQQSASPPPSPSAASYETLPTPAATQPPPQQPRQVEVPSNPPPNPENAARPPHPSLQPTDRMYDTYNAKRTSGIIMAGVLAPIFAGMTVGGTLLVYRHGLEDRGGFCNHVTRDDTGYYQRDCEGDGGELAGMIMISTFGTALTLSMLISGAVRIGRYGHKLRRLDSTAENAPLTLSVGVGPKEVSLGFNF